MTTEPVPSPEQEHEPTRPVAPVTAQDRPAGGFGRFVRRLARWVFWLLVITAIGVGAYYGWPVVQDRLLRPVETNTAQVAELTDRLAAIEERLVQLEARAAATEAEVGAVEAAAEETTGDVDALADRMAELDRRIEALERTSEELGARVDQVDSGFSEELAVLRAMELMSRARLFLYQANYGLAAADLRAARAVLGEHAGTPRIDEAVTRIDLALSALPARPVAAADDLDIAWALLLGDVAIAPPPAPQTTAPPTTAAP
jgi:uncharacterized coiled-coil protein SlyX